MHATRIVMTRILLLVGLSLALAACSGAKDEAKKKLAGTWKAENGDTSTFTADRLSQKYAATGGGMNFDYEITSVEGEKLRLSLTAVLKNGKTMPADDKVITFTDADTIDMRNAENDSGGVYKRQ